MSCYLLVIASGLVRDVYQRFLYPDASEHELRRLTYIVMIVIGVVWLVVVCALFTVLRNLPFAAVLDDVQKISRQGVTVLMDPEELVVKIVHRRELKVEEEAPALETAVVGEGEEGAEEGAPAAEEAETEK